jgi:hypothetical protein
MAADGDHAMVRKRQHAAAHWEATKPNNLGQAPTASSTHNTKHTEGQASKPTTRNRAVTIQCYGVQGKAMVRHDMTRISLWVVHLPVAATLQPPLRRLPGLEAGATATGDEVLEGPGDHG